MSHEISFISTFYLALTNHVHGLIAFERAPSRVEEFKKTRPGLTRRFIKWWSCFTKLFMYLLYRTSVIFGKDSSDFKASMTGG